MTSELPPDAAIDPIWFVEGVLAPDAEELRRPVRARHLARILELRDRGVIVEAGALGDMSASVLLVRAPDAEAAAAIAREDAYLAAGVWVEIRVRPFGRVVRPAELPGE